MTVYEAAITLFLVMDSLGNVPVFLSILNNVPAKKRQHIILREMIIAFFVLLLFLYFGKYILDFLTVSGPALSISGGIVLFIIAIKLIFPPEKKEDEPSQKKMEPFIVPLAIPLIAGPSAIAVVMLLATQNANMMGLWTIALFIAWLASAIILMSGDILSRYLGARVLAAIERLMGLILTTLAVQMLLTGISQYFHLAPT